MNRRTRRARRRLRRGDTPEPLLLITDDRTDLIDWAALLGRIGYRYRSELLPPAIGGALFLAAAILHSRHVTPWSVAVVGVVVAAGLCWPRVAPLLRPIERAYAVAVVVTATGWLTAATHYGPGMTPAAAAAGRGDDRRRCSVVGPSAPPRQGPRGTHVGRVAADQRGRRAARLPSHVRGGRPLGVARPHRTLPRPDPR